MLKHAQGTFRALGNIGDALMKMRRQDEALPFYHQQLAAAKQSRDRTLEACAYGALGMAHRLVRQFDKALGFHTQVCQNPVPLELLQAADTCHYHCGSRRVDV